MTYKHSNRGKIFLFGSILAASFFIVSCKKEIEPEPIPIVKVEAVLSNDAAVLWGRMTLDHLKLQTRKSPTYVSRTLGYIGLTMYETVVNGSIIYKSVAPELNGLGALAKPDTTKKYDWPTALNAGQAFILKKMWQHATDEANARVDSLETAILSARKSFVNDQAVIDRSVEYGQSIAKAIYAWSETDGGHLGYLSTFDANYVFPVGPQYWSPPTNGQVTSPYPMHPYWGKNRPFLKSDLTIPIPQLMEYSLDKTSAYYKEAKDVYDIQKTLTQEQKEIANWWGDDPSVTYAPPGHSYSLAYQLVKKQNASLFVAASAFAKVGISVADAFIHCWKCKYTYHSVRPTEYIRPNIDANYTQYWPEPPFPAFISGHSTQAAASAESLISIFGDNIAFDDETHVGRPRDVERGVDYKKRSYKKISDTAIECGISRLYGGIHTNQDNVAGLATGKLIGANVVALHWMK